MSIDISYNPGTSGDYYKAQLLQVFEETSRQIHKTSLLIHKGKLDVN